MIKLNTEEVREIIQNSPLKQAWNKIGIKDHHGINIPLFSIHSENSCGIGEFLDLKLLIDFCEKVSMSIIQLLPINDTGLEPSPYNGVSSIALNPIYLSLHALPLIEKDQELKDDLKSFRKYNFLQKVAYGVVLSAKYEFLKKYFNKYFENFKNSSPYLDFIKKNNWVYDYGIYKYLKEEYSHKGWMSWGYKHQNLSTSLRKKILQEQKKSIDFFIFLQFLSFIQMEEVKKYATLKNILIKGDIPILINIESLDVWQQKETFLLDYSAGAPPDKFSAKGQNWGFPIYNWKHIEKTNYSFWQHRLHIATNFYHIYRIDHIIGFYRIYAIPRGKKILKGEFIPPTPSLAKAAGEKILTKFSSFTPMLPIGEDMGNDIQYIRRSLTKNAIAGTKVPRWERDHEGDRKYIHYKDYNPMSLTTVSTHDSETLSQWWENDCQEAKEFAEKMGYLYQQKMSKKLRYKMLQDSHHCASIFHINLLSEYLALFDDLVWQNPNDERINVPGTVHPSNWSYKTRPSLEFLLSHQDLQSTMKSLINP